MARRTGLFGTALGILRLVAFVAIVGITALVATLSGAMPSADELRDAGDSLGTLAALVYVPAVAVLNSMFVFLPALVAAAGLLFGTAAGTPLALAGVTLAACTQLALGRYLAGRGVHATLPKRVRRVDDFLDRRGFWAVLYVRLFPFVPFVLVNYGAGVTRLSIWAMAAGTAIGTAPRVWAWVVLGGSIDDLGSPEAKVAVAMLVVIGLTGFLLARRQVARERRRRREAGGA
jgi:uncharacterized membrane protein YdjX (TVP38/TMEM64 family)